MRRQPGSLRGALLGALALWVAWLGAACASGVEVTRPEITIQGYVLARAPSGSAEHFIGRRYDPGNGGMGDRPCKMGDITEAPSSQRLSATINRKQALDLNLGTYELLGAAAQLDLAQIEGIRIELNTNRRAQAAVGPGCGDQVIFDAVAGDLYIEYQFQGAANVAAQAQAAGIDQGAVSFQIDERRNIISSTLSAEEFVAFQVHQPRDDSLLNLAIISAGVAAFIGGIATDVILARDGTDNLLEWAPVILYVGGGATAWYGYDRYGSER